MKLIDKILSGLCLTIIVISAFGECHHTKTKIVVDKHAITQALERFQIEELKHQALVDSLERETLLPRYKYLRGEIVYKHIYDTLTIDRYVSVTDSIIRVDSALIVTKDSIIRHYGILTNDLTIERDSIVESNIELAELSAKYKAQKKRRLRALVVTGGSLLATWLVLFL